MNAKVTLKEKMTIIKMLTKHFTIGEGAENLIDALTSACSEKEKQEERANLTLFAFATIAKPLVKPLQKEKDDEHFPIEEKIIIKSLRSKLELAKAIKDICDISLKNAAEKVSQTMDGGSVTGYTFKSFFIGNRPTDVFTIKQWKEICNTMSVLDGTFDWETLNIRNIV